MGEKSNLIKLEDIKALSDQKYSNQNYGKYLKGLTNSQLEIEVNHLIKIASEKKTPNDLFTKGKLILKEITSRVDPITKTKLHKLETMSLE